MAEPRTAPSEYYCADCLRESEGGPWNLAVTLFDGATLCARHVRARYPKSPDYQSGEKP